MKKRGNVLKKAAALFAVIVGGVVFCCSKKPETDLYPAEDSVRIRDVSEESPLSAETETEQTSEAGIWVYVCGAVQSPGVYYVDPDARVFEAVDLAGGFTLKAQKDAVNLAGSMTDGQRIFVPDISDDTGQGMEFSTESSRVNINLADAAELMTLPGIGEAKAQAIIRYRQEHPFQSAEDIMNVSGIKESSFEKIRDLITT